MLSLRYLRDIQVKMSRAFLFLHNLIKPDPWTQREQHRGWQAQRRQPEILTCHGGQMLKGDHMLLCPSENQEKKLEEIQLGST